MQTFYQRLWYLLIWYWMIVAELWNNVIQLVYYNIWRIKRWFFIISQCSWLCVTNWGCLIQTINDLITLFKAGQYHDSYFATFLWLKCYGRRADYPSRVCWVDVCGDNGISPCAPAGLSLSVPPMEQCRAELAVTQLSVLIALSLLPNQGLA